MSLLNFGTVQDLYRDLIMKILKYPRTRHIEGSRLQTGDLGDDMPWSELSGVPLIVEEKLDGANCAISFDTTGQIHLQSRGHFLTGGGRERHFALLKTWASCHAPRFHKVLSDRFIMYGEWLYAKHTVFYDALPHYFMEFDVWDRQKELFLSTKARRDLLLGLPIMPVPVLCETAFSSHEALLKHVQPSLYKTPNWEIRLMEAARSSGSRQDFVEKQTEKSDLAEGLYIKREQDGQVTERFKHVRADFHQAIMASNGHWLDRPILPNGLQASVDIFAARLGVKGAYDA